MTRTTSALALGALLIGSSALAQTAPAQTSQKPSMPAQLFSPQPATSFPDGARIGFINFQLIAESAMGKAASSQLKKLQGVKFAEIEMKGKALKALQDKQAGASILTASAAAKVQKDIERAQMDIQYAQQTAQKELDDLNEELMSDFSAKVRPVVEEIRADKTLWAVFLMNENLVAMMPGLDLSMEVVKRLDAKK